MNDEKIRLSTFRDWPVGAAVDSARVARGGFFCTGRGQEVECFSCAGRISSWTFGDQVMMRHRLLNPDCPFVLDPLGSGNVPAGQQVQGRPQDQTSNGNQPGNQTCNQTSNQTSNQTGEQTSIQFGNQTSNQLGNQTSNQTGNRTENQAGNQPSNQTGNQPSNQTGNQTSNQSSSGFSEQPPTQLPPGALEQEEDLTKDTIYKADMLRLLSFSNWPVSFISAESLALAGFYYVGGGGGGDRVRCAWCSGELQNWLPEDRPLSEHLRHFPHCTYAQNRQILSSPDSNAALVDSEISKELGIVAGGAGDAGLHSQEARLRSFPSTWPPQRPQQPPALAAAGFYYVGGEDQVRCFHCCGSLCNWQKEDDPWMEHARWFPHCGFLLLAKGQAFINAHKEVQASEELGEAVERCMQGSVAALALGCGLLPDTLKKAYRKRLQDTGTPFQSIEALINAALSEEGSVPPSVPPHNHPQSASASPPRLSAESTPVAERAGDMAGAEPEQEVSVEEENRRLKEARLCKVCMDAEVGVVFLPCGHLLSCVQCAPCLSACPLCRSKVKGIVRTYLS